MQTADSKQVTPSPEPNSGTTLHRNTSIIELLNEWIAGISTLGSGALKLAIADIQLAASSATKILLLIILLAFQLVGLWLLALTLLIIGLELAGVSLTLAITLIFALQLVTVVVLTLTIASLCNNMRLEATTQALSSTRSRPDKCAG